MVYPLMYTREMADEICDRMGNGESLTQICRSEGMPSPQAVRKWAREDRDGFRDKYARARDMLIEFWADEIVDIADDGTNDWMQRSDPENPGYQLNGEHVGRSRLRVDSRKWLLSHLKPGTYGDKVSHEHGSDPERPVLAVLRVVGVKAEPRE